MPGQPPGGATYTRVRVLTREKTDTVAFVYLLRCRDGSLYCGWTVDLDARLDAHAGGRGGRYTRSRLPVAIAAAWETEDHRTARSLEGRIKRLQKPAKEKLVSGAQDPDGARRVKPS